MNYLSMYFMIGAIVGILYTLAFMLNGEPRGRKFFFRLIDYLLMIGITALIWPLQLYSHFASFWRVELLKSYIESSIREEQSRLPGVDKDENN